MENRRTKVSSRLSDFNSHVTYADHLKERIRACLGNTEALTTRDYVCAKRAVSAGDSRATHGRTPRSLSCLPR